MIDKIKDWLKDKEDEIDFVSVMIVLAALSYMLVYALNWALVGFLEFTGLKWIVITIVITATVRLIVLFAQATGDAVLEVEEDDVDKFL